MELTTGGIAGIFSGMVDWASANWVPLLLTGEIIGAVIAIKLGAWTKGLAWLLLAIATIWIGGAV